MEQLLVVSRDVNRQVYIDGEPCGCTNTIFEVAAGRHTVDLGKPTDYHPLSQTVDVANTAPACPKVVIFT